MGRRPQRGPCVAPTLYRFGDCRIDLAARELRRGGELVVLSPRVFDCLALLIAHSDRAVGRDELVAHVWGKTEVTDTLLGQTILKARRAVGDSAAEQKAIRTIPRFGYAWVAPPERGDDDDARAPPGTAQATPAAAASTPHGHASAAHRRVPPRAWLALLVLFAACGAWLAWRMRDVPANVPLAADAAAVLPIVVSAPAEWSWVRLGVMDAIATRLQAGGQRVVPGDNVVAIARDVADEGVDDVVRGATGARYTVAGTAALNPDGWTVRLELRDGATVFAAEAHDADVLQAGHRGADRLLQRLGRTPPPDPVAPWPQLQLLQRSEAALLTNDLDGARRLLQSAPPALRESPELRLQLAKLDFRSGAFDAASQRLHALLAQSPAEADSLMRAKVLNGIGHVAMRQGRVDAAVNAYAEAARLLEDRDDPRELGHAWMGLGIAAQAQARYDDAAAGFARARIAFELASDGLALTRVDANEGLMDAARDRPAVAVTTLDRAARRFEQFGALNELAMTSSALVRAHLALLDPPSALAASERAWALRERLADAGIRHALAINRALALDANGRVREATALLESVVRTADPVAKASVLAAARGELARVLFDAGESREAMALARTALDSPTADLDLRERLTAWLVAIRALRASGHARDAAARTTELADWAGAREPSVAATHARLAVAEQRAAEQREEEASREYRAALEQAIRGGVPRDIAMIAASYGVHLLGQGDLRQASAVIGHTARWAGQDYGCALLQLRLHAALGKRQAWARSLANARRLAGERALPAGLDMPPEARHGGRQAAP